MCCLTSYHTAMDCMHIVNGAMSEMCAVDWRRGSLRDICRVRRVKFACGWDCGSVVALLEGCVRMECACYEVVEVVFPEAGWPAMDSPEIWNLCLHDQ